MAAPLDKHLALIGFMGAGKSRLGAEVAQRLGRPFVDLDREIESASGQTIPDLFAPTESRFSACSRPRRPAASCARAEPAVIALGGGAVETEAIVDDLKARAVTALARDRRRRSVATGRRARAAPRRGRSLLPGPLRTARSGLPRGRGRGRCEMPMTPCSQPAAWQVGLGGIERLASWRDRSRS